MKLILSSNNSKTKYKSLLKTKLFQNCELGEVYKFTWKNYNELIGDNNKLNFIHFLQYTLLITNIYNENRITCMVLDSLYITIDYKIYFNKNNYSSVLKTQKGVHNNDAMIVHHDSDYTMCGDVKGDKYVSFRKTEYNRIRTTNKINVVTLEKL